MKRRGVWILIAHTRRSRHMSSSQSRHPTFLSIAPRFVVHDLEQALAFLGSRERMILYQTVSLKSDELRLRFSHVLGPGWTCYEVSKQRINPRKSYSTFF